MLGNDEALITRFISIFKTQIPQQLLTLRVALEQQAWEDAALAAHDIKSQCRYFELEDVAEWCQKIEDHPLKESHLYPAVAARLTAVLAAL